MNHWIRGRGVIPVGVILTHLLTKYGAKKMNINGDKSGVVTGVGVDKLRIVIDGPDRATVESTAARELAQKTATERGFAGGGLCEVPQIGPVGADGEMLEGADALDPNAQIIAYRAEFTFARRP